MSHAPPEYMRRVCNRCGACGEHERNGALWSCSVCAALNPDSDDLVPRSPPSTELAHRRVLARKAEQQTTAAPGGHDAGPTSPLGTSGGNGTCETGPREGNGHTPPPFAAVEVEQAVDAAVSGDIVPSAGNGRALSPALPPCWKCGGDGWYPDPAFTDQHYTCDECQPAPPPPAPVEHECELTAAPTPAQRFDALEITIRQRDDWHRKCDEALGELGDMQTRAEAAEQQLAARDAELAKINGEYLELSIKYEQGADGLEAERDDLRRDLDAARAARDRYCDALHAIIRHTTNTGSAALSSLQPTNAADAGGKGERDGE